jgi:hypothetical protein
MRLAIAGSLAVGVSGAMADAMGAAYGRSFVSGDPPGVYYTKARCADYFEYEPHAGTCEQAATLHHFGETVDYRVAAGILGLTALAAYLIFRTTWRLSSAVPAGFSAAVATLAFGLAAVALLASSLSGLASGRSVGQGADLSAGSVSAVAAVISAILLLRGRARGTLPPASPGQPDLLME